MTNIMNKMNKAEAMLKRKYDLSDLCELYYCLEVEFQRQKATYTITMSQSKDIAKSVESLHHGRLQTL